MALKKIQNLKFESDLFLVSDQMKQPSANNCKYKITKVTLFKHATWQSVEKHTRRSSQPRLRQISTEYACRAMMGYTLKFNRSFEQLVHNSCIDLEIYQIRKMRDDDNLQLHPLLSRVMIYYLSNRFFVQKLRYGMLSAHAQSTE